MLLLIWFSIACIQYVASMGCTHKLFLCVYYHQKSSQELNPSFSETKLRTLAGYSSSYSQLDHQEDVGHDGDGAGEDSRDVEVVVASNLPSSS